MSCSCRVSKTIWKKRYRFLLVDFVPHKIYLYEVFTINVEKTDPSPTKPSNLNTTRWTCIARLKYPVAQALAVSATCLHKWKGDGDMCC